VSMLQDYRKAAFERCVNTSFRLNHPRYGAVDLRLTEVRAKQMPGVYESYNLYFAGPLQQPLQQQIYELNHSFLGVVPMFIVPIMRNQTSLIYEAVFNTLN
jgi:hypothetical protein